MKSFIATFCLLFCLCLSTAQARTDISGFQGMPWGSTLSDLQKSKKLVLTKENDGSGGSLYALQNASMRFGKGTLTGIHCSFIQGRLQGVILLFSGAKNYGAVKTEAAAKYGQPIKVDQKGGEMFTWPGDQTSIVLSYTKNAESGFLFLKPKKLAAKPKTAKIKNPVPRSEPAPPLQQPAVYEDLEVFDQASQAQRITVVPTPAYSASQNKAGSWEQNQSTPEAANIEVISPEIQGLIDRDQALTRLCWDTVGPTADQACEEMKENALRLQDMGWCMQPGDAKDGLQVLWYRCANGQASIAPANPAAPAPYGASPAPQATPPANGRSAVCSLVVELFAATVDMREKGVTPLAAEEALLQRQASRSKQLAIERIRETVELVYFDQQYNTLPLPVLTGKVEEQCLSGQGPYIQPLPQE
ncbi:MAG: hypothetical protein PHI97_17755 [Desulfobulbus sp.]|nr:hypothetical protein [Desulfobulbus sp.]